MATAQPGRSSICSASSGRLSSAWPSKIGPAGPEPVPTLVDLWTLGGNCVRRFPRTDLVSLLVPDVPRNDRGGTDVRYRAQSGSLHAANAAGHLGGYGRRRRNHRLHGSWAHIRQRSISLWYPGLFERTCPILGICPVGSSSL